MHRNTANPSPNPTPHYNAAGWSARRTLSPAFVIAGLLVVGLAGFYFGAELNKQPAEDSVTLEPMVRENAATAPEEAVVAEETTPELFYPVGEFSVDPARAAYIDESMELFIPKMDLLCTVMSSTDEELMKLGPGLYQYSQLPGPMSVNANVSIAGNRDIEGSEFLYIDQLEEGDPIYLLYEETLYTYKVTESFVTVFQDYFDPFRVKDFPCVTLQSCDPVGESRETQDRIFVTGELVSVEEGAGFPE